MGRVVEPHIEVDRVMPRLLDDVLEILHPRPPRTSSRCASGRRSKYDPPPAVLATACASIDVNQNQGAESTLAFLLAPA
jgi:hypothetical protein